jgi:hypothetical protein
MNYQLFNVDSSLPFSNVGFDHELAAAWLHAPFSVSKPTQAAKFIPVDVFKTQSLGNSY